MFFFIKQFYGTVKIENFENKTLGFILVYFSSHEKQK